MVRIFRVKYLIPALFPEPMNSRPKLPLEQQTLNERDTSKVKAPLIVLVEIGGVVNRTTERVVKLPCRPALVE